MAEGPNNPVLGLRSGSVVGVRVIVWVIVRVRGRCPWSVSVVSVRGQCPCSWSVSVVSVRVMVRVRGRCPGYCPC